MALLTFLKGAGILAAMAELIDENFADNGAVRRDAVDCMAAPAALMPSRAFVAMPENADVAAFLTRPNAPETGWTMVAPRFLNADPSEPLLEARLSCASLSAFCASFNRFSACVARSVMVDSFNRACSSLMVAASACVLPSPCLAMALATLSSAART